MEFNALDYAFAMADILFAKWIIARAKYAQEVDALLMGEGIVALLHYGQALFVIARQVNLDDAQCIRKQMKIPHSTRTTMSSQIYSSR